MTVTPDEHVWLSGPLIVVLPSGSTDSTAPPTVICRIGKLPVTWLPVVTSVARMMPVCVGVSAGTETTTVALPLASVATVSALTSGWAGLVDTIENEPCTTSKRTCRPGMPTPPGPVTRTAAVPVLPEQRLPVTVSQAGLGLALTVMLSGSSGAGCTVMTASCSKIEPTASRTPTLTTVVCDTGLARRTMVSPLTELATGSTSELVVNARYGGTPPNTVSVIGVPGYTVATAGYSLRSGMTGGGGRYGLFGAPLPPPHPARARMPAAAKSAVAERSHAESRRSTMVES